jgi:hypothetical protein
MWLQVDSLAVNSTSLLILEPRLICSILQWCHLQVPVSLAVAESWHSTLSGCHVIHSDHISPLSLGNQWRALNNSNAVIADVMDSERRGIVCGCALTMCVCVLWRCLGVLTVLGCVDGAWVCWRCLGVLTVHGCVDGAWVCGRCVLALACTICMQCILLGQ